MSKSEKELPQCTNDTCKINLFYLSERGNEKCQDTYSPMVHLLCVIFDIHSYDEIIKYCCERIAELENMKESYSIFPDADELRDKIQNRTTATKCSSYVVTHLYEMLCEAYKNGWICLTDKGSYWHNYGFSACKWPAEKCWCKQARDLVSFIHNDS
jgi:hypothetical protein